MKKLITLSILLFSIIHSYGQYDWSKGKLTLKNGETLKGYIRLPVISKNILAFNGKSKIKFRKTRRDKKVKFDKNQVELISFQYSDTEIAHYKYIPISKKKSEIFKVVVKGKATLYSRSVSMTSGSPMMTMGGSNFGYTRITVRNSNEYYVLRENETIASPLITTRISKSFRHRATEYFKDCPQLVLKLENRILTKDDIIDIVKEYNRLN